MTKWILPLACVVALGACGQMQHDRTSRDAGVTSSSSGTGAMSSGSYGTSGSSGTTGAMGSSGSSQANPNANPASANPAPGPAGAKARGENPSIQEPTTSGTTTK